MAKPRHQHPLRQRQRLHEDRRRFLALVRQGRDLLELRHQPVQRRLGQVRSLLQHDES